MALLLGFAIADPGFLTGEAFIASYEIDENDDVDSLLAKLDDNSPTDQPADLQAEETIAANETAPSMLTIPSAEISSGGSQTGLVQNVSYPSALDPERVAPITQNEFPLSLPVTAVPSNEHSGGTVSTSKTRGSTSASIRFMGTIYPAN